MKFRKTQTDGAGAARAHRDRTDARRWLCALIAGALTGLVGGAFRIVLQWADALREDFVGWAHHVGEPAWLLPVAMAALASAIARFLVRFAPAAAGSGVQHVEAVMRGEAAPARARVLPVKFLGGSLAIGSGLALGREGPTVQMGATVGAMVARLLGLCEAEVRGLQAATAGAGLAVAFNAPLGGALFTFEEVASGFAHPLPMSTLLASAAAIGVSRLFLGDHPDFHVAALTPPPFASLLPHLLLGALCGALGWAYNRSTLLVLDFQERLHRLPVEVRAALVGALVGGVGWFHPSLVGGGEPLNQRVLNGGMPASALIAVFVLRWLLGPLSYSAGTPGGIFAPLLVVGALAGQIFGLTVHAIAPSLAPEPLAYALVGMSALFAGVVRAPFTGIVLVLEMSAVTSQLVPMLAAGFAATAVASLAGSKPIYDTLRLRMLAVTAGAVTSRSSSMEQDRPG